MVKYSNVSLRVEPKYHRILLFRCFIGTVGIALQFYAMSKMVLTDAVVIIFTSPVLTFLLVRYAALSGMLSQLVGMAF